MSFNRGRRASRAPVSAWRLIVAYLSGHRGANRELAELRVAVATICSATFAAVAAGYASSFVVSSPWSLIIGLGWWVMIANLDTTIVALIGDRVGAPRWFALGPRLAMVALSGFLFAEVLMLRVFRPEVEAQLVETQRTALSQGLEKADAAYTAATKANSNRFEEERARHEKALSAAQAKIDEAQDRRRAAGRTVVDAAGERHVYYSRDGTPYVDPSHRRAAQAEEKRVAKEAEQARDQLRPELVRAREDIDRLREEQAHEQRRIDDRRRDDVSKERAQPDPEGLLARIIAFDQICTAKPSAWWTRLLLSVLLMVLELSPILIKLGERPDAATIRERMRELLRESLKSPRLEKWVELWVESKTHRYIDSYMKDVDDAMNASTDETEGEDREPEERAIDDTTSPPNAGGDGQKPGGQDRNVDETMVGSGDAVAGSKEGDPEDATVGWTELDSGEPSLSAADNEGADERVRRFVVRKAQKSANGAHTS